MKTIVVMAALALGLAACSDDAPGPAPATAAPASSVPVTTSAPVTTVADDADDADWSVAGALAQIPADDADQFELVTADLAGVAELFGVSAPDDLTDTGALFDGWLLPLTFPGSTDYRPEPVWVVVPEPLVPADARRIAEFDDLAGWSVADVDSFVHYLPPPPGYLVVADGEFADDALAGLTTVADGVVSSHAGEELAPDFAVDSPLDALGRPVRMARRGDRIAMSLTAEAATAWLSGTGPTLADDPRLAAVAAALDDADVLAAHLFRADFLFDPVALAGADPALAEQLTDRAPAVDPFDTVGIGWAVTDDGSFETVLVYAPVGGDPERLAGQLADVFAEGVSFVTRQPLLDTIGATDPTITAGAGVVTVTYAPTVRFWWSAVQAVYARDLPFVAG